LLWLASCSPLAILGFGRLEAGYVYPSRGERFDALLLLGGGTSWAPHGGQLSPSGDRVVTAARLYHQGIALRIVVSGEGVAALEPDGVVRDMGEQTRRILLDLAVPEGAIEVCPGGHNTREEVACFRDLVASRGWQRLGLLTSAWHLRRSMLHAERAGLAVVAVPSDFRGGTPRWNIVEILPSASGAFAMGILAWELLGITLRR
jgi:uncharacterized SAM-binding protein YcdF (DUF218 family)